VKVASYSYDAYGALTSAEVQPGIVNPYLFTGRELDGDSGLQYNRARYYLSGVGSWTAEDPLNYRSGPVVTNSIYSAVEFQNRFFYSPSNPTNYYDPFGNFSIGPIGLAIVGGIVGAAIGIWSSLDCDETASLTTVLRAALIGAIIGALVVLLFTLPLKIVLNVVLRFQPHFPETVEINLISKIFGRIVGLFGYQAGSQAPHINLPGGSHFFLGAFGVVLYAIIFATIIGFIFYTYIELTNLAIEEAFRE
jgi:RHS repeat-associated protein